VGSLLSPFAVPLAKAFLIILGCLMVENFRTFADKIQEEFMRVKALVLVAATLMLVASAWASSESVLYNFCSATSCVDGEQPQGSLVADASGHLYGTTYYGGTNGLGEVYELTNSGGTWTETVIYSFLGASNSDGAYPIAGVIFDATEKILYGVTQQGGASNQGTVFELTKSGSTWKETVLHEFSDVSGSDGYYPYAALVVDAGGNLYGTTIYGGKFGVGTVFQLKPSGSKFTYHLIHVFPGAAGGDYPYGGLVVDKTNGYLYGTAYQGGVIWNVGVVYQIREVSGVWISSVVYTLLGDTLGQYSYASLAADTAGNLYGTTNTGGNYNLGSVFKLTLGKNNTFTQKVIYSFKGYALKDGSAPYYAGVTLDAAGDLYGSTYQGGSSAANNLNYGTVYKLTAGTYKESVLWSFGTAGDGYYPYHQGIVIGGKVYGTTTNGGTHGGGVAYEVTP
jgi:uncharacterized repeat protein (TIGR03803 family)